MSDDIKQTPEVVEALQEYAIRAQESADLITSLQMQLDLMEQTLKNNSSTKPEISSKFADSKASESSINFEVEDLILKNLATEESLDSRVLCSKYNLSSNVIYGALSSLEGASFVIKQQSSDTRLQVTKEGMNIIENGSPEYHVFQLLLENIDLNSGCINIPACQKSNRFSKKTYNLGFGKCLKAKWIEKNADATFHILEKDIVDEVQLQLQEIHSNVNFNLPPKVIKILKKRKLCKTQSQNYWLISKGMEYQPTRVKPISDLTLDDIEKYMTVNKNDEEHKSLTEENEIQDYEIWSGPPIKPMNFNSTGLNLDYGTLHPLMKMREEMRRILLDMGFEEMPTNNYVQSSFWNFDALFQPQQHPARDAHDTFFLSRFVQY